MQSFAEALKTVGNFSEVEIEQILSQTMSLRLGKGDYLLRTNEVCKAFYYLKNGAMKEYRINREGDEEISNLFVSPDWIINRTSFTTQSPSATNIRAYDPCTLHSLPIENIHALIGRSHTFFQLGRVMEFATPGLRLDLSPEEKYQWILNEKSKWIQTFPLKLIASFLRITPETLSRVRKKMSR